MTQTPESSPTPENSPTRFHRYNESGYDIPLSDEHCYCTIRNISEGENICFDEVELVYVDENGIIKINQEHLGKDYVTDIITFSYTDDNQSPIEATLFCCAQRISEQAEEFGEHESTEFLRVFIHGLLHLCGYGDATDEEKYVMKEQEDHYLKAVSC